LFVITEIKIMKAYALTLVALTCFSGCGDSHPAIAPSNLATVTQTGLFLAQSANQQFQSHGVSLEFANDSSFEMILNNSISESLPSNPSQMDVATCNIRITGSAAYYEQKATPSGNGVKLRNSLLELTPAQYEVLSSSLIAPNPATAADLLPATICNDYATALMGENTFDLTAKEYAGDHLSVGGMGKVLSIAQSSSGNRLSNAQTNTLGLSDDIYYFVKSGSILDITNSFLNDYADSSYTTVGSKEASLILDAGARLLTITDTSCGINSVFAVTSITTNGGTPLLRGAVPQPKPSPSPSPSSHSQPPVATSSTPTPVPSSVPAACSETQKMIAGVTAAGLEIGAKANICIDSKCDREGGLYTTLSIGQPGTQTSSSASTLDSVSMSFQSATYNNYRM
jgi:hypothetical protein